MHLGIVQGLVLESKILNVIMTNVLFQAVTNFTKSAFFEKLHIIKLIGNSTTHKKLLRNAFKNVIVHVCQVAVVAADSNEISGILTAIFSAFLSFGLNVSNIKSQFIDYLSNKFFKFKYLGFCFVYLPTQYIKKGGIFSRHCDITDAKFSEIQKGRF